MNKKQIGKTAYYISLGISVALLIGVLLFIKDDDLEKLTIYRYITAYFCFGCIIPTGIIIREMLVEEYIMKKMIIKIVLTAMISITGVIGVIFFVKTDAIALVMFLVSLLAMVYIMVPTIQKNNKQK